MTYEGDVDVIAADGKRFTFDSPEGVAWLQMYVDMVKAGTVDKPSLTTGDDRVGLLIFSAGQAPFYQTGPNLIREVKANNPELYEDMAVVPAPVGKSGVTGKGLMAHLGQGRHEVPERLHRARAVLHEPAQHGRLRQAGRRLSLVAVGVSRIRSSARRRDADRGQRPQRRQGHRRDLRRHRADGAEEGRRQRDRPQGGRVRAVQRRPRAAGADDAVAEANKLLE